MQKCKVGFAQAFAIESKPLLGITRALQFSPNIRLVESKLRTGCEHAATPQGCVGSQLPQRSFDPHHCEIGMSTAAIQRQYDEVIAAHYDLDAQDLTNRMLDLALEHVEREALLAAGHTPLKALDLGMGTGLFLEKLRNASARGIQPFGLDLSARMVDFAKRRIPDLQAVIDDAAAIDGHFVNESFGFVSTHFVTGFVPMEHLAPRIWNKLQPGGYWSFLGAVSSAYPTLQKKARSKLLRFLGRGRKFEARDLLTPVDCNAISDCFQRHGFEVCSLELARPKLEFADFDAFMEFAYHGGWLTPFIEAIGLQNAKPWLKSMLNMLVFPLSDEHHVAVGLARRPPN
ncbi:MAG: class I SAM-dependent methyltransferase [Pirellula sp.]|nr:class I SAM-dependent methyltransferase [Pirellula sp.]